MAVNVRAGATPQARCKTASVNPCWPRETNAPPRSTAQRKTKLKERSALPPEEHEQMDQMPDKRKRRSNFVQNQQEFNKEGQRYINGGQERSSSASDVNEASDSSVSDALRSRRERRARQRELIKAQEQVSTRQPEPGDRRSIASTSSTSTCSSSASINNNTEAQRDSKYSSLSSLSDTESLDNQRQKMGREPPDKQPPLHQHEESGYQSNEDQLHSLTDPNYMGRPAEAVSNNQRWARYRAAQKEQEERERQEEAQNASKPAEQKPTGDSVTQRLENLRLQDNSVPSTEVENNKIVADSNKVKAELERITSPRDGLGPNRAAGPTGDRTGLISQAMENLTKKTEIVKPEPVAQKPDIKLTESDLQWDRLSKRLHRSLKIRDMDFTDLNSEEETDVFATPKVEFNAGVPPPPPLGMGDIPPPPMCGPIPPPPPGGLIPPPPPPGGASPFQAALPTIDMPPPPGANLKKNKKTMKLHWRTVQPEQPHPVMKGETIWKNIVKVKLDPEKIEHLFETRVTDLKQKRAEAVGKKQITVLDPKRSNAINIGLTVLPPPRTIKTAILKMDNSIMNKEGIDKVLHTMIPTEEEKAKILEAQLANPDIPLGTAEQFLLTLSSISELQARLNVWLFKLEYETVESEVAEPLMDLKTGIDELLVNKTLKYILSTILAIGNFLNGAQVRGFSIDYLTKVPEVKDTVHKHSLLHHLCTIILEQFTDSTDLYSEIGPVTRCSRVDWDELHKKLDRLEVDCKASWDNLRAIVKHDGSSNLQLKSKMSEFISDAAERIMILQLIYKKVLHRYQKLLLYMGLPPQQAKELKVNQYCKIISEFALEYRTTREKVVQQLEKKANQRERKKTRGKMIVDMGKFKGSKNKKPVDDHGDNELQRVLANGYTSADDNGLPGRQTRRRVSTADNNSLRKGSVSGSRGCLTTDSEMYDTGDDEILEACVRTATTPSNRAPRERKRARNSRKSSPRDK